MMELANTFRNQHGGKVAITHFLDSGIKERMLDSQSIQPPDTDNLVARYRGYKNDAA